MMLKLPWSSTSLYSLSCNATTSDISNPKVLMKKQSRLFVASSSGLTISISRQNGPVSCEAAEAKEKNVADRLRQGSLTEDGLSYKEKFIVRSYEVGTNKTATVEAIANLLQIGRLSGYALNQYRNNFYRLCDFFFCDVLVNFFRTLDAAIHAQSEVKCNHFQSLGYSTDGFATTTQMRKNHLIWASVGTHIKIYKYPAWCDVVEIESWSEIEGRTKIRRDSILKDYATCEVIGRATSKFAMMNQYTRRPEIISDDIREEYLRFCPREPRLAFPEEKSGSPKKLAQLEDPAQYSVQGLVPRSADMDMNQHVNNIAYIRWVLESMPQEIVNTHELETITLDYKRECLQDIVVDSLMSPEPFEVTKVSELHGSNGTTAAAAKRKEGYCQFLHMLRLSGDGVEVTRGRTVWRKKPTRDANHSV